MMMKTIWICAALLLGAAGTAFGDEEVSSGHATQLFNGRDLTGWIPFTAGEKGSGAARTDDPKKVFTVVQEEGAPAIRVSGEALGGLTTKQSFQNYHLRLEFKWGEKKWPPRERSVRDSGLLYHAVGEAHPDTGWMQSFEYQIEEMDCGDFWSVRGAIADIEVERFDDTPERKREYEIWEKRNEGKFQPYRYKPGGTLRTFRGGGLMKSVDAEKPHGQWNVVDLYCIGDRAVHVINGQTNLVLLHLRRVEEGKEVPLASGRIQLQSEGAELFFRKIELNFLPQ